MLYYCAIIGGSCAEIYFSPKKRVWKNLRIVIVIDERNGHEAAPSFIGRQKVLRRQLKRRGSWLPLLLWMPFRDTIKCYLNFGTLGLVPYMMISIDFITKSNRVPLEKCSTYFATKSCQKAQCAMHIMSYSHRFLKTFDFRNLSAAAASYEFDYHLFESVGKLSRLKGFSSPRRKFWIEHHLVNPWAVIVVWVHRIFNNWVSNVTFEISLGGEIFFHLVSLVLHFLFSWSDENNLSLDKFVTWLPTVRTFPREIKPLEQFEQKRMNTLQILRFT